MGASFLNAEAGIIEAGILKSAAYLQGWIAALKSKDAKGWIIKAASEAQKATEFIRPPVKVDCKTVASPIG